MNINWQTFLATRDLKTGPEWDPDEESDSSISRPSVSSTRHYAILEVAGQDAATFLQGQTTCDVLELQNNRATPGAICNPKGRTLATFMMFPRKNGYWLIVPEALAASVQKKLRMYIFRSKVSIDNLSDSVAIFGLCSSSLPDRIHPLSGTPGNERYPILDAEDWHIVGTGPNQWLFIGAPESARRQWIDLVHTDGFAETGDRYWNLVSILNGIPSLEPETSEIFVPQMINLDALGGISFKKGCYTGQEIVARMHYLGKLKRRLYLAGLSAERLPVPGEPVYASGNEQSIGQIVNAEYLRNQEIRLLTVLQIDQAESQSIHLSDPAASAVKILNLPYTF